ncbi:MAG: kelch repeat-containing protein [Phycisphaerales bacterium]
MRSEFVRACVCGVAVGVWAGAARAGTWQALATPAPAGVNLMLLLSDGTVMCANNNGSATIGRAWYRLTPDASGSYRNGTWSTMASMIDTRLYYAAQVLMDGRVFVAGGEYGTGKARAEVYNPLTNTWSGVNPPTSLMNPAVTSPVFPSYPQQFFDAMSEILPDGRVLISPVMARALGEPLIYDPAANTWAAGPLYFRGTHQNESTWVKLADETILTIDPFGTFSERYSPALNQWINDGIVPASLYDPFGHEIGGAVLLHTGKALYLGATGATALYTPTGTGAPGAWAAGPLIPGSRGVPDGPAAVMVTGNVLCAASPLPTSGQHFPSPTTFLEYDPVANSFAAAPTPAGSFAHAVYMCCMLDLPDGTVLLSHMGADLYVYTPAGAPLAVGKPVVQSVSLNGDGSYHLTGTGLNGISEGASYGDDEQMNSNYPIVRLRHSNGQTYFARTYQWSSTGVMTGARVLSTEYRLPAAMPVGAYALEVVANGNASAQVSAPVVTGQPSPQALCSDVSASFTVEAAGVGPLSYQWRRGETVLVDGGNISGATGATLTISPVLPGDTSAEYTCVVGNALGSVTSGAAPLSVQACCDSIDYNNDGLFPDTADIDDFLSVFSGGPCAGPACGDLDFNNDGLYPDTADIDSLLSVFSGGSCL